MNKLLKTEAMKRLKKSVRNKRGTTLVEMVATVAILAIIASLSFEAMGMAAEEYRRVEAISKSERSISLFQENLNLYSKNAKNIKFVDNRTTYSPGDTIYDVMNDYIYQSSLPGNEPLQDAEATGTNDEYIDLFVYRSDDFTYTIGKYQQGKNNSQEFKTILEVSNIKEINFSIKKLTSSFRDPNEASYLFDYAVISPTGFEMTYAEKDDISSGNVIDKNNYSNKDGSYSVMTGTVLNNIKKDIAIGNLRICEDLNGVASAGNYKGDLNFVVIRTVPREAK